MQMLKKNLIAVAVSAAFMGGTAHAEIDGWATAGMWDMMPDFVTPANTKNSFGALNARQSAMQQGYFTMEDDYDIWVNPAYVNKYFGKAYGALTRSGIGNGTPNNSIGSLAGANLSTGFGNIGVFVGRAYSGDLSINSLRSIDAAINGSTLSAGATPNNWFDLFYGKDLGDLNVGVRFNIATFGDSNENPTSATVSKDSQELTMRQINIAGGVAMKSIPLDASFSLGLPSVSDYTETNDSGAAGNVKNGLEYSGMNIALAGRFVVMDGRSSRLTASGLFTSESSENKAVDNDSSVTQTDSYKDTTAMKTLGAFAAYQMNPGKGVTAVASGGFEYGFGSLVSENSVGGAANKIEFKESYFAIPVSFGVEAQAKENWKVRGSLGRVIRNSGSTEAKVTLPAPAGNGTTSTSTSYPQDGVNIGLGLQYAVGDLMVDAVLNRDLLFSGPNLITGGVEDLAAAISLIYKM